MRMRRRAQATSNVSGLVPMADMLSNTVGIMLFILAFTVLQTGGVLIQKRLPMERSSDAEPVYFVCQHGRLVPLDGKLTDKLLDGLGEPSYEKANEWISRFNSRQAEDEYVVVVPDGNAEFNRGAFSSSVRFVLSAEYKPKPNVGDTLDAIGDLSSQFHSHLQDLVKDEHFIYFFVYPDSIELFRQARNYAKVQFGVGSGWGPMAEDAAIRFILAGGEGRGITPAEQ